MPIELPKEKSDLDKIAEYAMSRNIDSVNIKDFSTHDIEVYVREQCDIMEEAATHIENAKAEYEAVTEEYNDIQIMYFKIESVAGNIIILLTKEK